MSARKEWEKRAWGDGDLRGRTEQICFITEVFNEGRQEHAPRAANFESVAHRPQGYGGAGCSRESSSRRALAGKEGDAQMRPHPGSFGTIVGARGAEGRVWCLCVVCVTIVSEPSHP